MAQRPVYPFCAIVGQEEMKLALILATISPDLSGVLIRGEKGTAKSTAVRGLAALLPQHREIPGPYHLSPDEYPTHAVALNLPEVMPEPRTVQVPVVELPVGATEDRVTKRPHLASQSPARLLKIQLHYLHLISLISRATVSADRKHLQDMLLVPAAV